jgi:hypothetical protein
MNDKHLIVRPPPSDHVNEVLNAGLASLKARAKNAEIEQNPHEMIRQANKVPVDFHLEPEVKELTNTMTSEELEIVNKAYRRLWLQRHLDESPGVGRGWCVPEVPDCPDCEDALAFYRALSPRGRRIVMQRMQSAPDEPPVFPVELIDEVTGEFRPLSQAS